MIARVRRACGEKRVGHTGTLDPMASGVLVVCVGVTTRLVQYLEEESGLLAKEYEAVVRFGFETTTDDAEGEPRESSQGVTSAFDVAARLRVEAALGQFQGDLMQTPPAFSAKKVGGRNAYSIARAGGQVTLEPVAVHVGSVEIVAWNENELTLRIACSRGTYIRALARDIGRAAGCPAHLSGLRRLRSGRFNIETAISADALSAETVGRAFLSERALLESWPSIELSDVEVDAIAQGRAIRSGESWTEGARVRLFAGPSQSVLFALGRFVGGEIRPFCVLGTP